MESIKDYLDVLRENYQCDVRNTVEGAVKSGKINEEEAAELLANY